MKIPLTKGYSAIVSPEDYERLSKYKWCASVRGHKTKRAYARTRINGKAVEMHRLVHDAGPLWVDHINGDSLDNRRENLRSATPTQNALNRTAPPNSMSARFCVLSCKGKWRVQMTRENVRYDLGVFDSPDIAEQARDLLDKCLREIALLKEGERLDRIEKDARSRGPHEGRLHQHGGLA